MTALFKRGLRHQWVQDVRRINAAAVPMVGEAFTLRYIPAREDLNGSRCFATAAIRSARRRTMSARRGNRDRQPQEPARRLGRIDSHFAADGERLRGRRYRRGLPRHAELEKLTFPCYHNRPSAPTNLTLHQAIDINVPIGCGDAPVFPGDVILGDAEGVVVIPAHLADELADECTEMTAFEDFVTEEVLKGRPIIGLYPATDPLTMTDFAAWRKEKGR